MAGRRKDGGAVGKGGVNPAPRDQDLTVRVAAEQLITVPIDDLVPYANNARVHSKAQITQLRASLREFGFVTPVLIDFDNNIIAGHGRVEAAQAEGMTEVPCVLVSNLTEAQRKAYILADNRLSETSSWDAPMLKIELEGLSALRFDTGIIGFDMPTLEAFPVHPPARQTPDKTVQVSEHVRAAPGSVKDAALQGEEPRTADPEDTDEYRQFVDKFKPKLTTDDCYTPENIYTCIRDWVSEHYGLEGAEVLRPFWPGGDYQSAAYPEGCVVIDNPPFSILSEICRWYDGRGIRYFLFAPTLTLFATASGSCGYVLCGVTITYANGAQINTSFVTNLGEWKVELAPELYRRVKAENDKNRAETTEELPTYIYPDEVLTSAACRLAKYGQVLRFRAEDVSFTRSLDAQKSAGKAIFGAGFLLSKHAAAECAAAERAAAERAAAELAAKERAGAVKWSLSPRELEIIRTLGKGGERDAGTETTDGSDCGQGKKAPEQGRGGGAAAAGA